MTWQRKHQHGCGAARWTRRHVAIVALFIQVLLPLSACRSQVEITLTGGKRPPQCSDPNAVASADCAPPLIVKEIDKSVAPSGEPVRVAPSGEPVRVSGDAEPLSAPTLVSVPESSNSDIVVTFSGNADASATTFNLKACTMNDCETGCVGATTSQGSPGSIPQAALTDGAIYYACVQAADGTGQSSAYTASAATIIYDITLPVGSLTFAQSPVGYAGHRSPDLTLAADTDAIAYQLCHNTADAGSNCTDVARSWSEFATTPEPYSFSADGSYTLYVQFKDHAGNIGPTASGSIVIDTTVPTVTINALSSCDPTPNVSGTISEIGATINVKINGVIYAATDHGDGTWSLANASLAPSSPMAPTM